MDYFRQISHPDEIFALVKYKVTGSKTTKSKCDYTHMSSNLRTCYDFLNRTSRSFAAVIQALDGELRDAVCIFYLVLRALDTVEDDMSIPLSVKVPMLKEFYKHLDQPNWSYTESTEKDKIVLEKFPVISAEYRQLKPMYREVISDICAKMGEGMTVYLTKAPDTLADWDEYCYYVAGLVGIGLSKLFSHSNLEDKSVGRDIRLANSMGLFLQKTNIIRDYLEDVLQGRHFWPKKVWSKYGDEMIDLSKQENRRKAICCLNELVTNALQHVPDVYEYMSRIQNETVFNFCAIPQVMAIATLERCYNNPKVFEGVVKIRKGEAVKMLMGTTNMDSIKAIMKHFCSQIKSRIPNKDPVSLQTHVITDKILSRSETTSEFVSSSTFLPLYVSFGLVVGAILWQYWHSFHDIASRMSPN